MANQWLTGSGVPSTGIGQVTDYYRDTVNNLVYYRENAFTWVVVPAFTPSPDGIGTTWLHGNVPPLTGQGSDGDYYYDEVQLIVYRKDVATWVPKGSLDFIGLYGVQWGNGLGAPASTVPLNALPAGSFYLDVVTSDIYFKETSMSWELKGQLGGGGGSSVTVEDALNSNSTVNALSANQGRVLNDALADKCPLVEGKVPSANLPSYVDDALEFANLAAFPETGESGKIYLAVATNLIYRWTGSVYVLIGDGTSVDVVAAGSDAFPRYDQAQTLTDPQKAQILTNIGAKKSYNLINKTASYTLALTDFQNSVDLYDKVYLRMALTALGDVTISSALTSLPNLTEITIRDLGTARATLVEDGTVLNGIKTFTVQNEAKTLVKVGANEWDIIGALT